MRRKRSSRFLILFVLGTSLIFLEPAAAQEPKYSLEFELADAETGKPIRDAAILYKEDESTWFGDGESSYEEDAYWLPFVVIRDGKVLYRDSPTPELGKAHFQILANGYRLKQIKLKELLQVGQPVRKAVELEPLPSIQLKIQRQDGSPVSNTAIETQIPRAYAMTFRARGGHLMKHLLEIDSTTDADGIASFPRPALGAWSWYRVKNEYGHADFSFEANARKQVQAQERIVELRPRVAVQGTYRPKVRKNEYLKVYAANYDRISGDGKGEAIQMNEDGSFELKNRLATWQQVIHWSFFIDEKGDRRAFSLGSYGPFPLHQQGEKKLDIGKDSVHVTARLVAKDGRKFSNGFQVYASGGGKLAYPHEPKRLNHQESVDWWDATWDSPKGRDYLDYLSRNVQVPVSLDGNFHFPLLPVGEYELVLHCPNGESLDIAKPKFSLSKDQLGKTVDLGGLEIVESKR